MLLLVTRTNEAKADSQSQKRIGFPVFTTIV